VVAKAQAVMEALTETLNRLDDALTASGSGAPSGQLREKLSALPQLVEDASSAVTSLNWALGRLAQQRGSLTEERNAIRDSHSELARSLRELTDAVSEVKRTIGGSIGAAQRRMVVRAAIDPVPGTVRPAAGGWAGGAEPVEG